MTRYPSRITLRVTRCMSHVSRFTHEGGEPLDAFCRIRDCPILTACLSSAPHGRFLPDRSDLDPAPVHVEQRRPDGGGDQALLARDADRADPPVPLLGARGARDAPDRGGA